MTLALDVDLTGFSLSFVPRSAEAEAYPRWVVLRSSRRAPRPFCLLGRLTFSASDSDALLERTVKWFQRLCKKQGCRRVNWPAASTFGNILRRAGLASPKRKKRRTTPYSRSNSTESALVHGLQRAMTARRTR
jgi:hypothetical protein